MEIPKNQKVHESKLSVFWFNEENIVYSISKEVDQSGLTREEVEEEMRNFRKIVGDRKVCIVVKANPRGKPPRKELRDIIASELNSVVKAMAIITSSPLTRMTVNLFFAFKPPSYPTKMFTSEAEATKWIKQYC